MLVREVQLCGNFIDIEVRIQQILLGKLDFMCSVIGVRGDSIRFPEQLDDVIFGIAELYTHIINIQPVLDVGVQT